MNILSLGKRLWLVLIIMHACMLTSAQWTVVGSLGFSAGSAEYTAMGFGTNDTMFVAYRDGANGYKPTVKKYNGSSWVTVGTAGLSAGNSAYCRLAFESNGTPYIAYDDGVNAGVTVKKFVGGSWTTVGSAGMSSFSTPNHVIRLDNNDVPYVVFDYNNTNLARVRKFDGSSWVNVGGALSSSLAEWTNIVFDSNNDIYVAYEDGANSNKATVKKYNGSSWVVVGSAGFSAGAINEMSFGISDNDTLYISYQDKANSDKLTVMKFNGTSWVNVGGTGVSPDKAYLTTMQVIGERPYVGFCDGSGSIMSVMTYDGSSWSNVGSRGFSTGAAYYPSLAKSSAGDLAISYEDFHASNNMKIAVMEYDLPALVTTTTWNGSTWSNGAPTSTIDAVIASSTAVGSDFSCKDITINSGVSMNTGTSNTFTIHGDVTNNGNGVSGHGTVIFAKSGTITLSDTLDIPCTMTVSSGCTLTTNGRLRLKSSASDTGRVGNSAGVISGDVICERYIPGKRAFRFLAHPFSTSIPLSQLTDDIDITGQGGATNGFTLTSSNNPSAFSWEINGTGAWQAYTSALTNSWDQYEHLRIMIRGAKGEGLGHGSYTPSAVTLDMHGPINQGTHTITLEAGTNSPYFAQGGNPFPCAVALSTVTKGADVGSTIYLWNPQAATNGAYASQPFGVPFKLAAYSSFHATLSGSADTDVEFEEADKTTKGISYFKPTATGNYWAELVISDSTHFWDKLFLNFNDKSMDVQDKEDGIKHMNPNMDFYVSTSDDVDVAVDSRPYKDGKSIPLGLRAYVNYGTYVIRVGYFDIAQGTKLYLHDKFLNKKEEIIPGMEYWFDVTTDSNSQGKNRFEVNMKGQPLTGLGEEITHASKVQLIPNPARNIAKVSFEELEGNVKVTLLSVTGNVLYMKESKSTAGSISIPLSNLPSGVYMVHLESDNASFTEKLIKE